MNLGLLIYDFCIRLCFTLYLHYFISGLSEKIEDVITSDLDLSGTKGNENIPSDTLENEKKEDFEKEEDTKVEESLTIEDELRQKDIESVNKENSSSKDGKKLKNRFKNL